MSGTFDPNNPPVLGGFYANIVAAAQSAVAGDNGGVLALPIIADWGPIGSVQTIKSVAAYDALFSNDATDGRLAVVGALTGDGNVGDGVSALLIFRINPTSVVAAAASHAFQNTTPATALTLTGLYKGIKGNAIAVTKQAHPTDGTKDQLLIYDGTTLKETWSYVKTDIASLASQINNVITGSKYVTAVANITGVALATVTSTALTGGANGTAQLADYSTMLGALQSQQFDLLAIPNMTDAPTLAAVRAWQQSLNSSRRRIMLVEGGAANEAVSDAVSRSALSATDNETVNFGYNMFVEAATGNTYSTAQMVGYFAGMIAGKGITSGVMFDRLQGFTLVASTATGMLPTPDDAKTAMLGGVNIFTQDTRGIRLESEVTTFTYTGDTARPVSLFSSIKFVRTLNQIDTDLTRLTEDEWIGKVANTEQSRTSYKGEMLAYFRTLEGETALQPGLSTFGLDTTKDNTGDTLWPEYSITTTKTIKRVLATGQVA